MKVIRIKQPSNYIHDITLTVHSRPINYTLYQWIYILLQNMIICLDILTLQILLLNIHFLTSKNVKIYFDFFLMTFHLFFGERYIRDE